MAKVILTGYTSPVGMILNKYLKSKHEVIEISRTTGYDLRNKIDIENIIELSNDVDHFINLANVGDSQTKLLLGVYNNWESKGKYGKIIIFGTFATMIPIQTLWNYSADMEMISSKLLLEETHKQLQMKKLFGKQPQSILIRFMNYGAKTGSRSAEPYTDDAKMIEIFNFVFNSTSYISTLDFREI